MASYETIIFGGSFDPVHNGHIAIAREVAAQVGAQRIVIMPTPGNPLKATASASVADRLAMLELAVGDDEMFEICDHEMRKTPPTYTIETAEYLISQPRFASQRLAFVMGADSLEDLPHWRRVDELLGLIDIIVACRPPEDIGQIVRRIDSLTEHFSPAAIEKMKSNIAKTQLIDISSTDIRQRLSTDQPITGLVPTAVEQYLLANGLYR